MTGLWPRVVAFDNLVSATRRAAQGKRTQRRVAAFLADREPEPLSIQRALLDESWRPGPLSTFVIHDPKRRVISVAPFHDRVVHHALIDVVEPVLDRRMIDASFACRRGKGTHAALDHAQTLVRRHRWFLKMDVASYFASIRHAVIANLVLGTVDRHVLSRLRISSYARYMDDIIVLADDRERLAAARAEIEAVLASLGLSAKPTTTLLARTRDGLPFLGFSVFAGLRRIRPANRRRIVARWRHRISLHRRGLLSESDRVSFRSGERIAC